MLGPSHTKLALKNMADQDMYLLLNCGNCPIACWRSLSDEDNSDNQFIIQASSLGLQFRIHCLVPIWSKIVCPSLIFRDCQFPASHLSD